MSDPGPRYTVRLSRVAAKFLDTLPTKHCTQIDRRLAGLESDPRPQDSIQLSSRGKERGASA